MRASFVVVMLALVALESQSKAEDAPTYSKQIAPLLQKYCLTCHGDKKPKAGLSITNYDRLFKTERGKITLIKGEPQKSLLVTTMDGTKGKKMPPPKYTMQPTKAEIDLVRKWVQAGAKND